MDFATRRRINDYNLIAGKKENKVVLSRWEVLYA